MPAILFSDTETTGLEKEARVVEYAHIVCRLDRSGAHDVLRLESVFETLVNPGIKIPEGASKVHGVLDEDVADAPLLKDILPPNVPKESDLGIYGHNFCRYDMEYLDGLFPAHADIGCTLRAARRWIPEGKHSLDKLRVSLQLPDALAHSAAGDCHTTMHVVNHILSMGIPWEEVQAEMLTRLELMPWGKHKNKPLEDLPAQYRKWLLEEADAVTWELRRALLEI